MSVMAKYVRIFWPSPKDEDVNRRNLAVPTIQAWISTLKDAGETIQLASALAESMVDGKASDVFAIKVEEAIVGAGSAAFVREDHDLEIIVVAFVAVLDIIRRESERTQRNPVDLIAAALWSALSFQLPNSQEPIELLRQEVLTAAYDRTMRIAERSRERSPVPEVGLLSLPESQPIGSKANAAYRKATEPLVKALRENAELDREELEFLWWKLEDWSNALNGRLSDADPFVHAVVAGIDCASKLRRLPASGHRNVALRGVSVGSAAHLTALLDSLEAYRTTLAVSIDTPLVKQCPTVFPLLATITSGDANRTGANIERDARNWGSRALLEAGLLQVTRLQGG